MQWWQFLFTTTNIQFLLSISRNSYGQNITLSSNFDCASTGYEETFNKIEISNLLQIVYCEQVWSAYMYH